MFVLPSVLVTTSKFPRPFFRTLRSSQAFKHMMMCTDISHYTRALLLLVLLPTVPALARIIMLKMCGSFKDYENDDGVCMDRILYNNIAHKKNHRHIFTAHLVFVKITSTIHRACTYHLYVECVKTCIKRVYRLLVPYPAFWCRCVFPSTTNAARFPQTALCSKNEYLSVI